MPFSTVVSARTAFFLWLIQRVPSTIHAHSSCEKAPGKDKAVRRQILFAAPEHKFCCCFARDHKLAIASNWAFSLELQRPYACSRQTELPDVGKHGTGCHGVFLRLTSVDEGSRSSKSSIDLCLCYTLERAPEICRRKYFISTYSPRLSSNSAHKVSHLPTVVPPVGVRNLYSSDWAEIGWQCQTSL